MDKGSVLANLRAEDKMGNMKCLNTECGCYDEDDSEHCNNPLVLEIDCCEKSLTTKTDNVAKLQCSDGLVDPAGDEEMLIRAMKKAVEVGIFPKHPVDTETYLKHWAGMKEVLQAAVGK